MRKFILAATVATVATLGLGGSADGYTPPDFKLKCSNGDTAAKIWLNPFKVVNQCPAHSKDWIEITFFDTDEDVWFMNVAAGAKYVSTTNYSTEDAFRVSARIGRGFFCIDQNTWYIDPNGAHNVYRPGSTWRPTCARTWDGS